MRAEDKFEDWCMWAVWGLIAVVLIGSVALLLVALKVVSCSAA